MGIINIVAKIKKIHTEDIVLIKIGDFYYSYGKDAYIMSYIFQYKLMKINGTNVYSSAFSKKAYSKVISQLEHKRVNYIIIDRRNNYEVEEKSENSNLNNYEKYYKKAKEYINIKVRIERINEYLMNNMQKPYITKTIAKIERDIYERGKI